MTPTKESGADDRLWVKDERIRLLEAERDALRKTLKQIADGDPIYWTFERARLVARAALVSEDCLP